MADEVPLYDAFSATYDVMVDWATRLEREWPFFEAMLGRARAGRVLDVGCGTGGHAIRFAQSGREVIAADPSAAMLEQARQRAAGITGLSFVQAGFGELCAKVDGQCDVVTCLGNTLPHVLDRAALLGTLADMAGVLRPGGLLIVQQLNYDRICRHRPRFLGLTSGQSGDEELLFLRFYDYADPLVRFNVVTLRHKPGAPWGFTADATLLRPTRQGELAELLDIAGFAPVEYYGGYDRGPFDPERSNDLVFMATKRSS